MIAFLVCGCLRQSPPPSTAFLTVESNTQEFRHVPAGIVQEAAFTITNSSNLPVQLTIRRTSCSCATAELRDSRLASGESTELNLAINTAGFEKIDATVEVNCVATHTNGTQSSEVQLLRASVADISHRYGLQPSALNFGIVRRDASKASLDFRILMPESQLTAQRMETDDLPPSIQVESTGISTLESGDIKLHGRVTITPEKLPIGLRESEFVIPIRVLPQGQQFALPCSLEARHPVAVTPGGLFFPAHGKLQALEVATTDGSDLAIGECGVDEHLGKSVRQLSSDRVRIEVQLRQRASGVYRSTLRVPLRYGVDQREYDLVIPIIAL